MDSVVNPEMILLARESRGLTQKQLADRAGLSQPELSRYEKEERNISNEQHLHSIAEVLGYPTSFFYQTGARYGLGSNGMYHRKMKTVSSKVLDKLIAKVNIFRIVVKHLLDSVEIEKPHSFPQFDVEDFKGDIELIAEAVRATWKLPPGPVRDLVGVIENAGGIVNRLNFDTQKIDALVQWIPPEPPVFLVNDSYPGDRLRFTLAHEIGHLVMHSIPRANMEEEADRFASAFLMPRRDILSDFKSVTLPYLAQLKPYWRVSIAALIRRARDLNKISDRQYRTLMQQMSAWGYRTVEPNPIPIEKPTLLKEIFDAHLQGLEYCISDLANLLSLGEEDLLQEYFPQTNNLRLITSSKIKKFN